VTKAPIAIENSDIIGNILRLEKPDRPAPIVHPPASTPPIPINPAPSATRPKCEGPSKLCHDKRRDRAADRNAPETMPATNPTPNFASTAVAANVQKILSVQGDVNAMLSNAIGSKSSYKTNPVPTQPITTSAPIRAAPRRLISDAPLFQMITPLTAATAKRLTSLPMTDTNETASNVGPTLDKVVRTGAKAPFNAA